MANYRQALEALAQAPLAHFVAERKRLAATLRAAGDGEAATQLMQRRRPTASAWAVNQLYWRDRSTFDALLRAAAQIRTGDLSDTPAYRDALAALGKRAAAVLREAGYGPTASTLRRVTGTLAAVAAAGGFDPDPPGALAGDRDPPGFDALAGTGVARQPPPRRGPAPRQAAPVRIAVSEGQRRAAAEAEERARQHAEQKAPNAERRRLTAELHGARAALRGRERAAALRRQELEVAAEAVERAGEAVRDLERKLGKLDDG